MAFTACDGVVKKQAAILVILPMLAFLIVLLSCAMALAHGGKTHEEGFTALQALQKGTVLYDRLIVSGKLDASWETGLSRVEVVSRRNEGSLEYRVGFHRDGGDPPTVYIFLSSEGEYSGSNFDGQW
jgi:hypothetical protein